MDTFLATVFVLICVLLIIVVLLQKGRGQGLGGAFGGVTSSAFGTRTGDVFTWVTIALTGIFLLLAVGITLRFRPPKSEASQPVFYPPARAVDRATPITVQSPTPKADIFFTVNGQDPTQQSSKYDSPVLVQPGTTLRAKAFVRGWVPSAIATAEYLFTGPSFTPAAGPLEAPADVTIKTTMPDAAAYYTLDGAKPDDKSTPYTKPVSVQPGQTLSAVAIAPSKTPSAVTTVQYARPTTAPATGRAPAAMPPAEATTSPARR